MAIFTSFRRRNSGEYFDACTERLVGWLRRTRLAAPLGVSLLVSSLGPSTHPLFAQDRLLVTRQATVSALYETWQFGGAGVLQPTADQSDTVRITSASQWSLPFQIRHSLNQRWTIDVSGAYARGAVELRQPDKTLSTRPTRYTLDGPTDIRTRATGRFFGDNLSLTLGANLPSGRTSLSRQELSALQVLAAPALSFATPVLGIGGSGTAGVVYARQVAHWALAVGSSYEVRKSYVPLELESSLLTTMRPGNVVHASAGIDGMVGQSGVTFGISTDVFDQDRVVLTNDSREQSGVGESTVHLGPIITADVQLRPTVRGFRELTLYAVDRHRAAYQREGSLVSGTSANYLDAGISSVLFLGPKTGLVMQLNARHQTGMSADSTLATAAIASASVLLGVEHTGSGGQSLQPFIRLQAGQLQSGSTSSSVTGLSAGLTIGQRY